MPPTWTTLTEIGEFGTVAGAMAASRTIHRVEPKLVRDGGVYRVVLPGDPRYSADS
jgi:hypothetical protein